MGEDVFCACFAENRKKSLTILVDVEILQLTVGKLLYPIMYSDGMLAGRKRKFFLRICARFAQENIQILLFRERRR